jgi:hypothetical protein
LNKVEGGKDIMPRFIYSDDKSCAPSLYDQWLTFFVLFLFLFVIAVTFYKVIVLPHVDINEKLIDADYRYQKKLDIVSHKSVLGKKLEQWESALDKNQSLMLSENTFSLAASALQERIKFLVSLHNPANDKCFVQQQQNIEPVEDDVKRFTKVTVRVSLMCELDILQAIFYDLELEKPSLVLDNVTITLDPQGSKNLTVRFDVSGYIKTNSTNNTDSKKILR